MTLVDARIDTQQLVFGRQFVLKLTRFLLGGAQLLLQRVYLALDVEEEVNIERSGGKEGGGKEIGGKKSRRKESRGKESRGEQNRGKERKGKESRGKERKRGKMEEKKG